VIKKAERFETRANDKKKTAAWTPGNLVRLVNLVTKVGLKDKLRGNKWEGPFVITQVFDHNVELDITGKHKVINNNRIKLAEKPRSSRFGRVYRKVERLGVGNE